MERAAGRHDVWKIGYSAPDPNLLTTVFFAALGEMVHNEAGCTKLGDHLVREHGTVQVGMMMEQLTTVDMSEALRACEIRAAYSHTISMLLTEPGDDPHQFKVPTKKRAPEGAVLGGGVREKKMCKDRPTITQELGGPAQLQHLFSSLRRDLAGWCTVAPRPSRLTQIEVNTVSACFAGAVFEATNGNLYADADFLSAAHDFLFYHFPLLNMRSGKDRTWCPPPSNNPLLPQNRSPSLSLLLCRRTLIQRKFQNVKSGRGQVVTDQNWLDPEDLGDLKITKVAFRAAKENAGINQPPPAQPPPAQPQPAAKPPAAKPPPAAEPPAAEPLPAAARGQPPKRPEIRRMSKGGGSLGGGVIDDMFGDQDTSSPWAADSEAEIMAAAGADTPGRELTKKKKKQAHQLALTLTPTLTTLGEVLTLPSSLQVAVTSGRPGRASRLWQLMPVSVLIFNPNPEP